MKPHKHYWRVAELPREGNFEARCVDCGERRLFPQIVSWDRYGQAQGIREMVEARRTR